MINVTMMNIDYYWLHFGKLTWTGSGTSTIYSWFNGLPIKMEMFIFQLRLPKDNIIISYYWWWNVQKYGEQLLQQWGRSVRGLPLPGSNATLAFHERKGNTKPNLSRRHGGSPWSAKIVCGQNEKCLFTMMDCSNGLQFIFILEPEDSERRCALKVENNGAMTRVEQWWIMVMVDDDGITVGLSIHLTWLGDFYQS